MNRRKQALIDKIIASINNEINELQEITDILSDDNSVTDTDDLNTDLKIMKAKSNAFKDAKLMVMKASLDVDSIDNEKIMTASEKRLFYKLVKLITFIRKIFRRK